jgi:uncharacterized protein YbcV (DUF1398 family)
MAEIGKKMAEMSRNRDRVLSASISDSQTLPSSGEEKVENKVSIDCDDTEKSPALVGRVATPPQTAPPPASDDVRNEGESAQGGEEEVGVGRNSEAVEESSSDKGRIEEDGATKKRDEVSGATSRVRRLSSFFVLQRKPGEEGGDGGEKRQEEMRNYLLSHLLFDEVDDGESKPGRGSDGIEGEEEEEGIAEEGEELLDPNYVAEMEKLLALIDSKSGGRGKRRQSRPRQRAVRNPLNPSKSKLKVVDLNEIKTKFEKRGKDRVNLSAKEKNGRSDATSNSKTSSIIEERRGKLKGFFQNVLSGNEQKGEASKPVKTVSTDLKKKFECPELAAKLRAAREEEEKERRLKRAEAAKAGETTQRLEEQNEGIPEMQVQEIVCEVKEEREEVADISLELKPDQTGYGCGIRELQDFKKEATVSEDDKTRRQRLKREKRKVKEALAKARREHKETPKKDEGTKKQPKKVLGRIQHLFEKGGGGGQEEGKQGNVRDKKVGQIDADQFFAELYAEGSDRKSDFRDPSLSGVALMMHKAKRKLELEEQQEPRLTRGVEKSKRPHVSAVQLELKRQLELNRELLVASSAKPEVVKESPKNWSWKSKSQHELAGQWMTEARKEEEEEDSTDKAKQEEEEKQSVDGEDEDGLPVDKALMDDLREIKARMQKRNAEEEERRKTEEHQRFFQEIQEMMSQPVRSVSASKIPPSRKRKKTKERQHSGDSAARNPPPVLTLTSVSQLKTALTNQKSTEAEEPKEGRQERAKDYVKNMQKQLWGGEEDAATPIKDAASPREKKRNEHGLVELVGKSLLRKSESGESPMVGRKTFKVPKRIIQMPDEEDLKKPVTTPTPSRKWKFQTKHIEELQAQLDQKQSNSLVSPSNRDTSIRVDESPIQTVQAKEETEDSPSLTNLTEDERTKEYEEFVAKMEDFLNDKSKEQINTSLSVPEVQQYLDLIDNSTHSNKRSTSRSKAKDKKPNKLNLNLLLASLEKKEEAQDSETSQKDAMADKKRIKELQDRLMVEFGNKESGKEAVAHVIAAPTASIRSTFEKKAKEAEEEAPILFGPRTCQLQRGVEDVDGGIMSLEQIKAEREREKWRWREKEVQDLKDKESKDQKEKRTQSPKAKKKDEVKIELKEKQITKKSTKEMKAMPSLNLRNVEEIEKARQRKDQEFEQFLADVKQHIGSNYLYDNFHKDQEHRNEKDSKKSGQKRATNDIKSKKPQKLNLELLFANLQEKQEETFDKRDSVGDRKYIKDLQEKLMEDLGSKENIREGPVHVAPAQTASIISSFEKKAEEDTPTLLGPRTCQLQRGVEDLEGVVKSLEQIKAEREREKWSWKENEVQELKKREILNEKTHGTQTPKVPKEDKPKSSAKHEQIDQKDIQTAEAHAIILRDVEEIERARIRKDEEFEEFLTEVKRHVGSTYSYIKFEFDGDEEEKDVGRQNRFKQNKDKRQQSPWASKLLKKETNVTPKKLNLKLVADLLENQEDSSDLNTKEVNSDKKHVKEMQKLLEELGSKDCKKEGGIYTIPAPTSSIKSSFEKKLKEAEQNIPTLLGPRTCQLQRGVEERDGGVISLEKIKAMREKKKWTWKDKDLQELKEELQGREYLLATQVAKAGKEETSEVPQVQANYLQGEILVRDTKERENVPSIVLRDVEEIERARERKDWEFEEFLAEVKDCLASDYPNYVVDSEEEEDNNDIDEGDSEEHFQERRQRRPKVIISLSEDGNDQGERLQQHQGKARPSWTIGKIDTTFLDSTGAPAEDKEKISSRNVGLLDLKMKPFLEQDIEDLKEDASRKHRLRVPKRLTDISMFEQPELTVPVPPKQEVKQWMWKQKMVQQLRQQDSVEECGLDSERDTSYSEEAEKDLSLISSNAESLDGSKQDHDIFQYEEQPSQSGLQKQKFLHEIIQQKVLVGKLKNNFDAVAKIDEVNDKEERTVGRLDQSLVDQMFNSNKDVMHKLSPQSAFLAKQGENRLEMLKTRIQPPMLEGGTPQLLPAPKTRLIVVDDQDPNDHLLGRHRQSESPSPHRSTARIKGLKEVILERQEPQAQIHSVAGRGKSSQVAKQSVEAARQRLQDFLDPNHKRQQLLKPAPLTAAARSRSCANLRTKCEDATKGVAKASPSPELPRRRQPSAEMSERSRSLHRSKSTHERRRGRKPERMMENQMPRSTDDNDTSSARGRSGMWAPLRKNASFSKFKEAFETGNVAGLRDDEEESPAAQSLGVRAELQALKHCPRLQKLLRINRPQEGVPTRRASRREGRPESMDLDDDTMREVSRSKAAIKDMFEANTAPKITFGGGGKRGGDERGAPQRPVRQAKKADHPLFTERKWVFDAINKYFDVIKEEEEGGVKGTASGVAERKSSENRQASPATQTPFPIQQSKSSEKIRSMVGSVLNRRSEDADAGRAMLDFKERLAAKLVVPPQGEGGELRGTKEVEGEDFSEEGHQNIGLQHSRSSNK